MTAEDPRPSKGKLISWSEVGQKIKILKKKKKKKTEDFRMGSSMGRRSHEGRKISMHSETPPRPDQQGELQNLRVPCNSKGLRRQNTEKVLNSTSQPIGSLQATAWTRGLGKGA